VVVVLQLGGVVILLQHLHHKEIQVLLDIQLLHHPMKVVAAVVLVLQEDYKLILQILVGVAMECKLQFLASPLIMLVVEQQKEELVDLVAAELVEKLDQQLIIWANQTLAEVVVVQLITTQQLVEQVVPVLLLFHIQHNKYLQISYRS
jgi:hypothetical protein